MNTLNKEASPVLILAKMWREDGVWNVSAFDIPVIAYGEDFEKASNNFEEALASHFDALKHFNLLDSTVADLQRITQTRDYTEFFKPRETVKSFPSPKYHPAAAMEMCTA